MSHRAGSLKLVDIRSAMVAVAVAVVLVVEVEVAVAVVQVVVEVEVAVVGLVVVVVVEGGEEAPGLLEYPFSHQSQMWREASPEACCPSQYSRLLSWRT
jgi:hypothetical protein